MTTPHPHTRAASANHTERGAPRHEPFRYIYEERGTPDLAPGDIVTVVDTHSSFFEKTGVVDTVLTPKKYLIKFNWGACAIHPFKRSQLAKVERKGACWCALMVITPKIELLGKTQQLPKLKRPDRFMCEWKTVDLPSDIPRRWIEFKNRTMKKKIITPPVICLPAMCESTRKEQARAKFEAFMARCAVEYKQEEMFVESLDAPQSKSQKTAKKRAISRQTSKHTQSPPKQQERRKMADYPRLRIRSYAA